MLTAHYRPQLPRKYTWEMTDRKQRISAAANAVKLALSVRRAEFENERHRIEGEVNEQGGGVALLSSGLAVVRFADEVQRELRKRSELARRAIDEALTLQELRLRSAMAVELKEHIRRAWVEEIEDLREWYQKRVSGANEEMRKSDLFSPQQRRLYRAFLLMSRIKPWRPDCGLGLLACLSGFRYSSRSPRSSPQLACSCKSFLAAPGYLTRSAWGIKLYSTPC